MHHPAEIPYLRSKSTRGEFGVLVGVYGAGMGKT